MHEQHDLPDSQSTRAGPVRERMDIETGVGVLIGLILSAIFLTGIVSIFKATMERPKITLPILGSTCLSLFIAIRLTEEDMARGGILGGAIPPREVAACSASSGGP